MSEQNETNPNLGSSENRASKIGERLLWKVDELKWKIGNAVDDIRYRSKIPKERRERAVLGMDQFLGEAMSYLGENTASKLAPIHPSAGQPEVLKFLFESTDDGTLTLYQRRGYIVSSRGGTPEYPDKPMLQGSYQAWRNLLLDIPRSELAQLSRQEFLHLHYQKRNVHVLVGWAVNEDFPDGFSITNAGLWIHESSTGKPDYVFPGKINFMVLPKKAENPDEIVRQRSVVLEKGDERTSILVFSNGERINVNEEWRDGKKDVASVTQYYLIGSFDGQEIGKSYWLYGSNDPNHTKVTERENVAVQRAVTQPVRAG